MAATPTDLDLDLDLHDGGDDSDEGAVGRAGAYLPRLERHVDLHVLDEGHRSEVVRLKTQCPVDCRTEERNSE